MCVRVAGHGAAACGRAARADPAITAGHTPSIFAAVARRKPRLFPGFYTTGVHLASRIGMLAWPLALRAVS